MRFSIIFAATLGIGTAAYPLDAASCDCDSGEKWLLLPQPNATGVPTNTRLWTGATSLMLEDETGTQVDLEHNRVRVSQGWASSYRPVVELQPHTRYTMRVPGSTVTFTTGAGSDTTPPGVPSMTVTDSIWMDGGDSCGEWLLVVAQPIHDGAFVVVDAGSPDEFDPSAWSGRADDVFARDSMLLGRSLCFNNIPYAQPGSIWSLRLLSIDLAGNVSEWSQELSVQFPEVDSDGNGAGGAPGGGSAGGGEEGAAGAGGSGWDAAGHGGDAHTNERATRASSCTAAASSPSLLALLMMVLTATAQLRRTGE